MHAPFAIGAQINYVNKRVMKRIVLLLLLCVGIPLAVSAVVPTISISSNKGTTVCSGESVTFTASITSGGTSPSYQWRVNGNAAGANASTFVTSSLNNNDVISCVLTSNDPAANPAVVSSNNLNMTVNPTLTPVIAITLTPNDTICAGTSVTFSATIANGGSTPDYQWKVNGTNAGSNSNSFITSTLADGDVVTCVLTSNATCVTQQMDTSNAINMTVNPILTPVVTISVSPNDTICDGTSTTFTATPTNGGNSPSYQWKRNGVTVGTNSNTYTTTALANGDDVECIMTTSELCVSKAKDTSNTINMTVNPNLTPAVSITANPGNTVCAGTSVTFTATPVNGGSLPAYQWRVNGFNAGTNSNTFTTSGLSNGDVVTCVLTSSEVCVTSGTAISNGITMTVNPIITPSVSVAVSPNDTVCAGTNVTFTATPTNGGTSPTYQWQLNGVNAGANSATFSSTTFSSGDMVRVIMTSNDVCLTKPADTSSATTMEVIPNVTPAVVITHFPTGMICDGTNVTFTASAVNEGATPTYQWLVNGVNVGASNTTYSTTTLADGYFVECVLTSSITCVTKPSDTSNTISVDVKSRVEPIVTISVSPNDTVCAGDNVTFTATAIDAGTSPSYEWQVNGAATGTNSNTFMTTSLNDGDVVRCIVTTSDTCVTKNMDTSNVINMTIKPILTPVVTIAVSPNDTVCDGDMVTFTATPTDGGTTPIYQWLVNGNNVGTNSTTYSSSTLNNNDVVTVIMTSSEQCVTKQKDTSNAINMTVKPNLTPVVTTIVLPNDTVCDGTNVTFIATPVNEGTTPTYQWQVNGNNVGTNNTSYSSTTLANGDVVRCIMTSSEMCVTKQADTSDDITMTVNPNLTPEVTIVVSPDDTICVGTSTTFTATPTNGGTTPVYQWQINGSNVGSNSNTYTSTTLTDGDAVRCIMTSSEVCVTKAADTSNVINMTVKPYLTPVVTIAESPNDTICDGTNVTFTATPVDGGTTPVYQWQINGSNVGTNSATFSSSTLVDNDVVRVIMTSSEMCLTKNADTSNEVTMEVIPVVTPMVTVTVSPNDTVCDGTIVSFLATPTNGGTAPDYQWKVNGNNVGLNNSGYATSGLVDGDVVTCVMTSNAQCTTKPKDTSDDINMTIIPLTKPTVSISTNTGTTACVNGEVTFTANFSNGGSAQAYQWRQNGTDIAGANASTYMNNNFSTGDVITVRMDITAACPDPDSAISNALTMNIVVPSMDIMVSPNDTICENESAVFNVVNATNIGGSPEYQWELNGTDQTGVVSNVFTMNSVSHQDVISVRYTGSDNCINAPATASNNTITMTVKTTASPSVGITANPGDLVNENAVVFFTSSVNAPNASYQWRKNGVNIPGATGPVYTDINPQDGDSITLFVDVNDTCRMPDTAVSNMIVMKVIGTGVREVETEFFNNVSLAPNPNNGTFTLSGTLAQSVSDDEVYIEVVNAVGQVIYKEPVLLHNNELKTRIDLGDKAHNGLHIVRITASSGKVHLLKFIANR